MRIDTVTAHDGAFQLARPGCASRNNLDLVDDCSLDGERMMQEFADNYFLGLLMGMATLGVGALTLLVYWFSKMLGKFLKQ